MFQGRVYKLQTEKLISAMSWPKMSVSGLVQAAILVPVPVFFHLQCTFIFKNVTSPKLLLSSGAQL